jgi:hypothetical protein
VLVDCLLAADHVTTAWEMELLVQSLTKAFGLGAATWLVYLGLEPAVRRQWPQVLVGASRLLHGQLRDPRVGRDLLVGTLAGTAFFVAESVAGSLRGFPAAFSVIALGGLSDAMLLPVEAATYEIVATIMAVFLLAMLRRLVRHELPAAAIMVALLAITAWGSPYYIAVQVVFYSLFFFLVLEAGALAAAAFAWSWQVLADAPLATDLDGAGGPATLVAVGSVLALAAWGAWHARRSPARAAVSASAATAA